MSKVTRRFILGLGGAVGAAGLAYGGGLVACTFVPRTTPDFFARLPGMDEDAVRLVGRLVIDTEPGFARRVTTGRLLDAKPQMVAARDSTCIDTQLALVQDQCRRDFDEGKVMVVDGWIISETEALLAAETVTA